MSDQKKKTNASMEGMTMRERSELLAEQKEQRRWRTYGIIAAVVGVLVVALLFWDHGFIQRSATAVTIGDRNYSAADLDYYYYSQYNNIYPYASYYGLDTSKSLRDQEAYDGQTWYEYLRSNAEEALKQVSTLAQEGEAEGYTISEEGQKNIDTALQNAKDEAKENDVSMSYYLRRVFGRFMTWNRFEKLVTEQQYAYDYQSHKTDGYEVTEDELSSYYTEHKGELDTFDYQAYYFSIDAGTDEEGNEIVATQEQIDEAKAKAEKMEAALKKGNQAKIDALATELGAQNYSDTASASLSDYTFGSWLTDESRKAGDTSVIEDSHSHSHEDEDHDHDEADSSAEGAASTEAETSAAAEADTSAEAEHDHEAEEEVHMMGYYAVRYNGRALDEYKAINVLTVTVPAKAIEAQPEADSSAAAEDTAAQGTSYDMEGAKAAADAFVEQWQAQGGTEQALRDLTKAEDAEESETTEEGDTSAAAADTGAETYTLSTYTSVDKNGYSFNDEIRGWLYDTEHKAGDYAVMEYNDNNSYLVVYVTGYDEEPYWKTNAKASIQGDKFTEWLDSLAEKYTPKETWFYSQVG